MTDKVCRVCHEPVSGEEDVLCSQSPEDVYKEQAWGFPHHARCCEVIYQIELLMKITGSWEEEL